VKTFVVTTSQIRRSITFLAASIASLFLPSVNHAEVFTEIEDVSFVSVAGVVSTAAGPAVLGNTVEGETNPPVRWTSSTGAVLIGIPPLSPMEFRAEDVSANGAVVVGRGSGELEPNRASAYRWSNSDGLQELTTNIRDDHFRVRTRVSTDGTVVTGFGASQAFRWQQETGIVGIGARLDGIDVIGPDNPLFFANDLSSNGSVIVGMNTLDPFQLGEAARWTAADGAVGLGFLFGGGENEFSTATGVSGDGSMIAGTGIIESEDFRYSEAFRWTKETGMVRLGDVPGGGPSFASAMSSDGSVIVGGAGLFPLDSRPFVWTLGSGMQLLVDLLTNEYGIGDEIAGWNLGRITALSRDGRYIVGQGTDGNNLRRDWLVDLGANFTPIPEPGTYGLIGAVSLLIAVLARRRRAARTL
jgi:uncharacterized membrane protein